MSTDYSRALGARLRAIRNQQGLSLQGVEDKSHGRWKAVVVGSYERGDRAVTVQRLSELAVFYGVPVSELLPDPRPSSAVTSTTKIVLNLESLGSLPADEAGPLARYASTIQAQRHDYNGKVLSIRAEDLKSLAIIYDMSPDELTTRLIEWGVLSPGMESVVGFGGSEDDDEAIDPHWERRRSPR
jgi:transcriptional regulator with XRE-family HTH domain